MVFADAGDIVSGGNFHGAPVAMAADLLAIAVAQLATISERRTERLVNPALSDLPAFLTARGGVQSGMMMAQVTAAALTSEIKGLAHPASVDTIPTSANKEDHVSMSMGAALKAQRAVELGRYVLAVEALCALPGHRLPGAARNLGAAGPRARRLRAAVPTLDDDRPPAPDLEAVAALIAAGTLEDAAGVRCQVTSPELRERRFHVDIARFRVHNFAHSGRCIAMTMTPRHIRAPRGTALSCKGWPQEAALRMLMNNLDPEVAERPDELIVYGGSGQGRAQLGVLRRDRRARCARSSTTRRCWCSRASPSASSARIRARRAS